MKRAHKRWLSRAILLCILAMIALSVLFIAVLDSRNAITEHNKGHAAREMLMVAPNGAESVSSPRCASYECIEPTEMLSGERLYQSYVDDICQNYYQEVDPAIVKAVIHVESRYQPDTYYDGAVGLMQVIPKFHAWRMEKYGLTDIWDPYANIIAGVDFLNELHQVYGNWYDAIRWYNCGSSSYANEVFSQVEKYM